jgi:hypothetical protein
VTQKIKYAIIILLAATLAVIGYFRDFAFVNINYKMESIYYHKYEFKLPTALSFLDNFSYSQLYYLKYTLTFFSILGYLIVSLLIVFLYFKENKYVKIVFFSYLIVTLVSCLAFLTLIIFTNYNTAFFSARKILEIIESPVLIMILFPILIFKEILDKKHIHEKR